MKKLAISAWSFLFEQETPTTDFHELLHSAAHLSYEGVELGAFAPHPNPASHDAPEKRRKLRRMVETHDLALTCLAADLWSQKLVSVAEPGPFVAAFQKNLDFAVELGIKMIRVDTVEALAAGGSLDSQTIIERATAGFDRCAKLAAPHNANVAWEFDPAFPLNKPAEIVELVRRVRGDMGNSNFGVLFNSCHAHICSGGAERELLNQVCGDTVHVHLADSDGTINRHGTSTRVPFGAGRIDFERLFPELAACGAAGEWWGVDLCFCPNAWTVAAEARHFLDRLRRKLAS